MIAVDEPAESADPESIVRLRGEPPRVMRLSRKTIAGAGAAALLAIGGTLVYALQPPSPNTREIALNTSGIAMADGIVSAPKDYSSVPKLGPPLPGDLGRPILTAGNRGAIAALPPVSASPVDASAPRRDPAAAARERMTQERDAARTSKLFLPESTTGAGLTGAVPGAEPAARPVASPIGESRPVDRGAIVAPSDTMLLAGSIIPAALITGIRSDQPGMVTAQVTQNVFDSLTGRRIVVRQGARLIGEYSADVGFGQRRVRLEWNRLILPDGRSISLDRQPATDAAGFAGLEDKVDFHWGGVLKAALVSTLLGVGGELGAGSDGDLARAIRRGAQDSIGRAGEQVVSRELGVKPTLTIRPGYPVRVLVTRDIDLGSGS